MSGFVGAALNESCVLDVFFATDYHSHLGTRRAGMAFYDSEKGFSKSIHDISNTPFRTKFDSDMPRFKGNLGIGCISDYEAQPLMVRAACGTFAVTTVGKINNLDALANELLANGLTHFNEMSSGEINATELVATLISSKPSILEGLKYVQERVEGSISVLVLSKEGVYCARDKFGRTPIVIAHKDSGFIACFESSSYLNLGYEHDRDLGPGEIVLMTPESVQVLKEPGEKMKICSFLWVYYGYPTSTYEGVNVECMRNHCGKCLAKRDMDVEVDAVAGVPDSGIAHAVGYSNERGIPFTRPYIKYTPTWPRSFMPTDQSMRNVIAKMKLIPIKELIEDKRLLLIDDSIVRGTQLGKSADFLYKTGAKEIHVRPACPPIMFGCKYLNFSRSTSEMDLIARRVIRDFEGDNVSDEVLKEYANPDSEKYAKMCEEIRKRLNFTSLKYHRLDDMIESIGIDKEKLCTYCWDGEE